MGQLEHKLAVCLLVAHLAEHWFFLWLMHMLFKEGNIYRWILLLNAVTVITFALVYLVFLVFLVKWCFQVKRNRKHYRFPKNILHCEITLSEQAAIQRKIEKKKRKKEKENAVHYEKKSSQDETIVKKACALLNSGGGELRMIISDYEEIDDIWRQVDKTWQPLEKKLTNLVKPLTYNDVFDRSVRSNEINLLIKVPQHLCTIHFNLYFAGDAGTDEASFEQAVNILQNFGKTSSNQVDVPLKDLPMLPKECKFQEKLEYHESKQIQFKHFTSKKPILSNHDQRDSIRKHISAFGNTIGGEILLGVSDRRVVLGVVMEKNSKIEEDVNSMIKRMIFPVTAKRKVHWDIEFIPVSGGTIHPLAVVAIKVAGMKNLGGVFTKCPLSCKLLDHDTTQVIEFEMWRQRMLFGSKLQTGPTCVPVFTFLPPVVWMVAAVFWFFLPKHLKGKRGRNQQCFIKLMNKVEDHACSLL